jgi:Mce-associated membrane protein
VTSEARARARDEEETGTAVSAPDPADDATGTDDAAEPAAVAAEEVDDAPVTNRRRRGPRADGDGSGDADEPRTRSRLSLPLVPTLVVLLLLLLGAGAFLWFTRPADSAVRTGDYAQALQQARSNIVDFTSFDYLTLDDDMEQIRRVATGDLRDEAIAKLEEGRQAITDGQAVVNTEVVGAGVTRASRDEATAVMVIQSTQESSASPQAQVVRYRIEVTLEKHGDRWLLSGIKGTDVPASD